jgi:hypothetical protein
MIMMPRKGIEIPPLADPFYEVASLTEILPGQVVQIPSLYPNRYKYVLDMDKERYDPTENVLEFVIRPLDIAVKGFPIHRLQLETDEYFFAVKGKMRPAVVLAGGEIEWPQREKEKLFLCLPLYSVDKDSIKQIFVVKIQANRHPRYYYFPPSTEYKIQESVGRFELIQVVHEKALRAHMAGKNPVALSDEAFGCLRAHFCTFLGCEIPKNISEDLQAYGDLVWEEYKKVTQT